MSDQRKALIIASDEYEHEGLQGLLAPAADAAALSTVLGDPQIGDFAVQVVRNQPAHIVQAQIEDFLSDGRPDDVLLLHFSCHGLKSDSGELFLAARNTRPNRLRSTAIPADFVQRCMRASRSRSIVLLLDCCYGGAFSEGVTVRAAGDVNVLDSFAGIKTGGGRGRAVITASSAMEYAFEGERLADGRNARPSVFTQALVDGLATGDADRDEDGWISLNELYDYVFDKVREKNPHQTPIRDVEMQGELYVARSGRGRIRAAPLPPDLEAAIKDQNMSEWLISKPTLDLTETAPHMFWLMLRNVASDSLVFTDRIDPKRSSIPGCIIASPSYSGDPSRIERNYVYNWTRDAAIVAIELAAGPLPTNQPLIDYVHFAQTCQTSARELGHFDRASFLINGTPRVWTDQTDGPALQTLAIMRLFAQLDAPTQAVANAVITANVNFLSSAYQSETYNLWEEGSGASFFARSVQLKCFQAVAGNTLGIPVPGWLATAIPWLQTALASHWNGQYYQSLLPVPTDKAPYDPNIDIVMAAIYGAVTVTDTRLLATAALLRSQWADPASPYFYPINGTDQQRGIGPLLGRYPGDTYDGDSGPQAGDHPWPVSTANFAELYYRLAQQVTTARTVPLDDLSADFFGQIGIDASTTSAAAAAALQVAGDQMLQAVVLHSNHLELSEQYDATFGNAKSASNLSWSYAAFLSAIRAKSAS